MRNSETLKPFDHATTLNPTDSFANSLREAIRTTDICVWALTTANTRSALMVSEATYIERRKCSDQGFVRTQNWKTGKGARMIHLLRSPYLFVDFKP